jgi:hypothetical protein
MLKKLLAATALAAIPVTLAAANDSPIYGSVASKCTIYTDVTGVYAQPTPDELTTVVADGGIQPKIRYDVSIADYYMARISWPDSFQSSPTLTDTVTWTGETEVAEVTVTAQSDYETNKVEYNNVTEFDLDTAGTVWFKVTSTANYGAGKAFPAGDYTAVVEAECIAQ